MLQTFLRRDGLERAAVGVQLTNEGVSIAVNGGAGTATAQATAITCQPHEWRSKLESLCRDLGLARGTPANLVLPPDSYALLLLDPPDVPAAELKEAIRWRVRELVPFSVDDAVLDVFGFPEEAARGRRTCFVAVAERRLLQPRVDAFKDTRLTLRSIDITELALRNLIPDDCDEPVALLYAQGQTGVIALLKAGRLFLSRRVEILNAGDDKTIDSVLLQLQRSMDYFDSQLGQGIVNTVLTCMPAAFERDGNRRLQEMLPLPVHRLGEWLDQRGSAKVQNLVAAAVGAAWRRAA